ncbi:MAG: hypothetical protein AB9900_13150 [Humidesulfovibrio sp.]
MSKQNKSSSKGKDAPSKKSPAKAIKVGRDAGSGRFIPVKEAQKHSPSAIVVESLSGPRGQCPMCGKKKGLCTCGGDE